MPVFQETIEKKTDQTDTLEISVPEGDGWVVQLIHCWTDRQVKFVRLKLKGENGRIMELNAVNQARETAIVWYGALDLCSGAAIVMGIENNGNQRANASLTVRGLR
jgi:hypothetical protein